MRIITGASVAGFVACCAAINSLCLALSPVVVVLLWVYSYTKRFTALCHIALGSVYFFGPVFAWAAITGTLGIPPLLLGTAALTSIAGADIIYALQDYEFESRAGLYSLPVALGKRQSLVVAKGMHLVAVVMLMSVGMAVGAPVGYFFGIAIMGAAYLCCHRCVDLADSGTIDVAFFKCNTVVGMVLLLSTVGSVLWKVLS